MSSTRKLGTKSNASSRRSSIGAGSTTSSLLGTRKNSTPGPTTRTGRLSTAPAGPTVTAASTPSGPSSSSAALRRTKHATQRTTTIQTQSSPPDSKQHSSSLQWSSTRVMFICIDFIKNFIIFMMIMILINDW